MRLPRYPDLSCYRVDIRFIADLLPLLALGHFDFAGVGAYADRLELGQRYRHEFIAPAVDLKGPIIDPVEIAIFFFVLEGATSFRHGKFAFFDPDKFGCIFLDGKGSGQQTDFSELGGHDGQIRRS